MNWERQRAYDFDAGREEGARQKSIEAARNALALNLPVEQIAQISSPYN